MPYRRAKKIPAWTLVKVFFKNPVFAGIFLFEKEAKGPGFVKKPALFPDDGQFIDWLVLPRCPEKPLALKLRKAPSFYNFEVKACFA